MTPPQPFRTVFNADIVKVGISSRATLSIALVRKPTDSPPKTYTVPPQVLANISISKHPVLADTHQQPRPPQLPHQDAGIVDAGIVSIVDPGEISKDDLLTAGWLDQLQTHTLPDIWEIQVSNDTLFCGLEVCNIFLPCRFPLWALVCSGSIADRDF